MRDDFQWPAPVWEAVRALRSSSPPSPSAQLVALFDGAPLPTPATPADRRRAWGRAAGTGIAVKMLLSTTAVAAAAGVGVATYHSHLVHQAPAHVRHLPSDQSPIPARLAPRPRPERSPLGPRASAYPPPEQNGTTTELPSQRRAARAFARVADRVNLPADADVAAATGGAEDRRTATGAAREAPAADAASDEPADAVSASPRTGAGATEDPLPTAPAGAGERTENLP